jgi:hypothetical protein
MVNPCVHAVSKLWVDSDHNEWKSPLGGGGECFKLEHENFNIRLSPTGFRNVIYR